MRLVMNKKRKERKLFLFFHADRDEKKVINSVVFALGSRPSCGSACEERLQVRQIRGSVCERGLDMWVYILAGAITTPEAL